MCLIYLKECLDKCSIQVRKEVGRLERYIRTSEVGVCKRLPGSSGHAIPVADPVRTSDSVGELKLMVGRKAGKVFDFDVVTLSIGVGGTLIAAVARCSCAQNARVCIRRVIKPDDYTLPVMAMTARNISRDGLVLRKIPGVHNGKSSSVPGSASVDLSLVVISTSGARVAAILETTTVHRISHCSIASASVDH